MYAVTYSNNAVVTIVIVIDNSSKSDIYNNINSKYIVAECGDSDSNTSLCNLYIRRVRCDFLARLN